jgi:hypothetical protein
MTDYRSAAAEVLIRHSSYIWNKSGTRIRCLGDGCSAVLDAPGGNASAIAAFAGHQADQLPPPPVPVPPVQDDAQPPISSDCDEGEVDDQPDEIPQAPKPSPEPAAEPDQNPEPNAGQDLESAGEPMEQVLSEAALAVADQPTAPKVRRDTKALTATIAEIKKGDRVSAGFNHPRYGYFTVEGTVIKGGTGLDRNQLMVGGWYINLNERAAKYLCELEILAPAGKHDYVIPKPSELTEHVGIGN